MNVFSGEEKYLAGQRTNLTTSMAPGRNPRVLLYDTTQMALISEAILARYLGHAHIRIGQISTCSRYSHLAEVIPNTAAIAFSECPSQVHRMDSRLIRQLAQ